MRKRNVGVTTLFVAATLIACGKGVPSTPAPIPTDVTRIAGGATLAVNAPTQAVTLAPVVDATLTPPEVGSYQSVVEAFIATNQLTAHSVSYQGTSQVALDSTGDFTTEEYVDDIGNTYAVDPQSKSVVVFESHAAVQPPTDVSPLSEDELYNRAESFMLLNTPQYRAMREGFSLPDKRLTDSRFVSRWVFGTTCRRDGSFPYIEVSVTLNGDVLSYQATLARGDRVGAYGDVNHSMVNVRSGPGLEYEVVTVTGAGRFIIMGQYENPTTGEKWWQIPINCAEPTSGWVRDEFVTLDPAFVAAVPVKSMP